MAKAAKVVDPNAPKPERKPIDRRLFIFYKTTDGDLDIVNVFGDKRKAFDFMMANRELRMYEHKMDAKTAAEVGDVEAAA